MASKQAEALGNNTTSKKVAVIHVVGTKRDAEIIKGNNEVEANAERQP